DDCGAYTIHFAERILAQKEKFRKLLQTQNAAVHIDWQEDTFPLARTIYYSWLKREYLGTYTLVVFIDEMEQKKLFTDVDCGFATEKGDITFLLGARGGENYTRHRNVD